VELVSQKKVEGMKYTWYIGSPNLWCFARVPFSRCAYECG